MSDNKRYMLKFQFTRLREPEGPTWNHRNETWTPLEDDANPAVSRDVWSWMRGEADNGRSDAIGDVKEEGLFDKDECVRINTAYALANERTSIPLLVDAMRRETLAAIEGYDRKDGGQRARYQSNAGSGRARIVNHGRGSHPPLLEALQDDHWWVRAMAADVLARMGPAARAAVFNPGR